MNQINELPNDGIYEFGLEFNYSAWTPGTQVTLCNVPWNNDYRDIVKFGSHNDLDAYLADAVVHKLTIDKLTLCKPNQPIRLGIPFSEAFKFNYVAVRNDRMPISGSTPTRYYYFVTDVRYIAPNTTEIVVQLDVWQTFCHDVEFGSAYVERGHVGIANNHQFDNFGKDFLTIPEGLDLGNEYEIVDSDLRVVASRDDHAVMAISTLDLFKSGGNIDRPNIETAKGCNFDGIAVGCDVYYFASVAKFLEFCQLMQEKPWVTRGIMSVIAIPKIQTWADTYHSEGGGASHALTGVVSRITSLRSAKFTVTMRENWRDTLPIPTRYRHLKKFLTYPYCVVELTSYTGTPLILKPESLPDSDLKVVEIPHYFPGSSRLVWVPFNYNGTSKLNAHDKDWSGEFLDTQTGIMNFPQLPIVNDGYLAYMASNKNMISYQHSAADWSQQRAMGAGQLSYDQSSMGMDMADTITAAQVNAAQKLSDLTANTMAGKGILTGIGMIGAGAAMGGLPGMVGGIAGAAATGVSTVMDINANNQTTAINRALTYQTHRASQDTAGNVRDTNKSFADWAANGDYQNSIAAINAKVQDAKLTQPSISGQLGGDSFLLAKHLIGVTSKYKMVQQSSIAAIGDYWLRYGYAVNRFIRKVPRSLQVMANFTYWKMRETYIVSSKCPELYKQTIRGIFEKGVTVWAHPTKIGNVELHDNNPTYANYFEV